MEDEEERAAEAQSVARWRRVENGQSGGQFQHDRMRGCVLQRKSRSTQQEVRKRADSTCPLRDRHARSPPQSLPRPDAAPTRPERAPEKHPVDPSLNEVK